MSSKLQKLNVMEAKVLTASAAWSLAISWEDLSNELKKKGYACTALKAQETLTRCERQAEIDLAVYDQLTIMITDKLSHYRKVVQTQGTIS